MTTKFIARIWQWYRCFSVDLIKLFQLFKNKNKCVIVQGHTKTFRTLNLEQLTISKHLF
jgi:hypothetical protein